MENLENTSEAEVDVEQSQSLITDSFASIERLETEMAAITNEFESLDDSAPSVDSDQENSQQNEEEN